jgi:hypothetical protein|tara:strand:+ start:660 stop:1319 length:660 start_codon:yes stop_codon:yes gene_type:complete
MGFIINSYLPYAIEPTEFIDDYSSDSGWTLGNYMSITGGQFVYTNAQHTNSISTKGMGLTLSDTLWYADWDFDQTADNFTDNHGMMIHNIQSTTGDPNTNGSAMNRCSVSLVQNYSNYRAAISSKTGTTTNNEPAVTTDLANGTRFYYRSLRDSATQQTMECYTNSGRTSAKFTASVQTDLSSSVTGLDTYCHATGASATTEWISGTFNNIAVYSGVTP